MSEMLERVALAMEAKRRELIARPLASIWPELARAAIDAMREPTRTVFIAGATARRIEKVGRISRRMR